MNYLKIFIISYIVFSLLSFSFSEEIQDNFQKLENDSLKSNKIVLDFSYDESDIYLKISKSPYRIFYTSLTDINVFLPFNEIYNTSFNYKFYNVQSFCYEGYYSVLKIKSQYPILYSSLSVLENDKELIFKLPLKYKISNSLYFYDNDRNFLCKLDYFLNVDDLLFKDSRIWGYRLYIPNPEIFDVEFLQSKDRRDILYNKDGFWVAFNGTYFAKKGDLYSTVAGAILKDKILSYPVSYRPPRGFFAILKNKDDQKYFTLFDRLPVGDDFLKFFKEIRDTYDIILLLQSGPLIYKNNQFVMDPDIEHFGRSGNNIIDPAPRTFIFSDGKSLYTEVLYGYSFNRKDGLSLYQLANYLYETSKELNIESLSALNLDGGSSSCIFVNGKKLVPFYLNKLSYNSQNYVVFRYPKNAYYLSDKLYYFFPGVFDRYSENLYNPVFGSSYVTFYDGIDKYAQLINNDKLDYLVSGNLVFFQTNDLDSAIEKLSLSNKIYKLFKYYNCYIVQWRD